MVEAPVRTVPCDGCTACCEHDLIVLHPECGDNPAQFETVRIKHPLTGKRAFALKRKPEGGCIYLERGVGCTIHDRRPTICREFDCRGFVRMLGVLNALKGAADGNDVIRAGLARLAA